MFTIHINVSVNSFSFANTFHYSWISPAWDTSEIKPIFTEESINSCTWLWFNVYMYMFIIEIAQKSTCFPAVIASPFLLFSSKYKLLPTDNVFTAVDQCHVCQYQGQVSLSLCTFIFLFIFWQFSWSSDCTGVAGDLADVKITSANSSTLTKWTIPSKYLGLLLVCVCFSRFWSFSVSHGKS